MQKKMENEMETGNIWGIMGNWGFPKLGVPFGGPHNEDDSNFGSIMGFPDFGKLPIFVYLPKNLFLL